MPKTMTNIRVTYDSNPNNARSESSIVINQNNPDQIVCGSKKFKDIHNYDFTLATQYSTDGGQTWRESTELDITGWYGISDPALAWDDAGNPGSASRPPRLPRKQDDSKSYALRRRPSSPGDVCRGRE